MDGLPLPVELTFAPDLPETYDFQRPVTDDNNHHNQREGGVMTRPATKHFIGSESFSISSIGEYHLAQGEKVVWSSFNWFVEYKEELEFESTATPANTGIVKNRPTKQGLDRLKKKAWSDGAYPIVPQMEPRGKVAYLCHAATRRIVQHFGFSFGGELLRGSTLYMIGDNFALTGEMSSPVMADGYLRWCVNIVTWGEKALPEVLDLPDLGDPKLTWKNDHQAEDDKEVEESKRLTSIYTWPTGKSGDWNTETVYLVPKELEEIRQNYNDAVMVQMDRLLARIRNKDLYGGKVIVLYGSVGTGKTHLVGVILRELHRAFGHIPLIVSAPSAFMSSPVPHLLRAYSEDKPMAVVLEDSGQLVSSDLSIRPPDVASSMANMTDGLISSTRDDVYILTFNDSTEVDAAFLRPGRCISVLEVEKLTPAQQKVFFQKNGKPELASQDGASLSLAECYELLYDDPSISRKQRQVGFRR